GASSTSESKASQSSAWNTFSTLSAKSRTGCSSTSSSNALSCPPARNSNCSTSKATLCSTSQVLLDLHFHPVDLSPDLYLVALKHSEPPLCRLVLASYLVRFSIKYSTGELELARGRGTCVEDEADDDGE
nr:hypothetical protein [Tanacetum cinerariifolium]